MPLRLRVLSFNLWVDHEAQARLDAAVPAIAALAPDVVLLQEVRAHAGLADTALQLADALGLPGRAFAAMSRPKAAKRQGIAVLSRRPLRDVHITELPHDEVPLRYRMLSARLGLGGRTVGLHTTHLRWQPDAGALRRDQVKAMIKAIDAYPCDAHVLGGDFNAHAGAPELEPLVARMLDSYAERNPGAAGLTWSSRNPTTAEAARHGIVPDRRIDFLWCSPLVLGGIAAIEDARVVLDAPAEGRWLSDHFGLLADLALDAPEPPLT